MCIIYFIRIIALHIASAYAASIFHSYSCLYAMGITDPPSIVVENNRHASHHKFTNKNKKQEMPYK